MANRHVVIFTKANQLPIPRFGFSVGKKIGTAVVRNKVRRRLKEACRGQLHLFVAGYDYVIIARKGMENLNYSLVQKNLAHLARKLKKVLR